MRKKTPTAQTRTTPDTANNSPAAGSVETLDAALAIDTTPTLGRRRFLGTSMAALGAGTLLTDLGLARHAEAQNATPAPAGGPPPGLPPRPPRWLDHGARGCW